MPNLPELRILPTENLVIHEKHDQRRTAPLINALKSSRILRNPPIVAPIGDESGRFLVLDGANRTIALQIMHLPHIVAQVIDPRDPGLSLSTWNHVIWEHHPVRFLDAFRNVAGIQLKGVNVNYSNPDIRSSPYLAILQNCRGRTYLVKTEARTLREKVQILIDLVKTYQDRGRLDRTSIDDFRFLELTYPSFCGLVIFPQFSIQDLLILAAEGSLLPTGITRFTISPRILHLNYPLSELASPESIEEKNVKLHRTIQNKINNKSLRYYAEPTFLFDDSSE